MVLVVSIRVKHFEAVGICERSSLVECFVIIGRIFPSRGFFPAITSALVETIPRGLPSSNMFCCGKTLPCGKPLMEGSPSI